MNAIIVCTHEDRSKWRDNCLNSLITASYPVVVYHNTNNQDRFELGAIKFAYESGFEEFVLLQDSVEVKDSDIFNQVFNLVNQSVSLCNHPYHFGCYLGKYRAQVLENIVIPVVTTKAEAVEQEEVFTREYVNHEPNLTIMFPDYGENSYQFIEKFGEKRMVLENDYFIKYKSIWDRDML